jgi:hypothetical protein
MAGGGGGAASAFRLEEAERFTGDTTPREDDGEGRVPPATTDRWRVARRIEITGATGDTGAAAGAAGALVRAVNGDGFSAARELQPEKAAAEARASARFKGRTDI